MALEVAFENEGKARAKLNLTNMTEFPWSRPSNLVPSREAVSLAVSATRNAINIFEPVCEAETRASIANWIAAAPARMAAQAAAGAQSFHYMHTLGQLDAAASLAEAIRNKSDQSNEEPVK